MSPSLIWTDHAKTRLVERGLSQQTVEQAIRHADRKQPGKRSGTTEFSAEFDGHIITAVVSRNSDNQLVIISCWTDPPFEGTKDWKKKQRWQRYIHLPWWQKILWQAARQLGFWNF